jgi:prevent-host-death family protein
VADVAESIRQSELRNNNAEIMRRVSEGESFTVTVHGRAVADLVPHQRTTARRRLMPAAELDELLAASGPAPDPGQWSRDIAEADELFGDDHPSDPWDRNRER